MTKAEGIFLNECVNTYTLACDDVKFNTPGRANIKKEYQK